MSVLITYDLDKGWVEVKQQAFAVGFYNIVSTTVGDRVLPNTTLLIEQVTPEAALQLFDTAVARARQSSGLAINVEKMIVGQFSGWWIRSNKAS